MKALLAAVFFAFAAETPLPDPADEARAQALMREIRCVACENEPASQSAAPIAEDMRIRIRELVAEGRTDAEIRDWFESRYGEFVLFRPPARDAWGWLLWGAPFALLALGGLIVWNIAITRRGAAPPPDIEAP